MEAFITTLAAAAEEQPQTTLDAIKMIIEMLALLIASVGGIVAAFKAISEMQENRKQRSDELRWKQSTLAREALNELWDEPLCVDTMRMLDWNERIFTINGNRKLIKARDVRDALRLNSPSHDEEIHAYVRDCFDSFFGTMQIIEHYISINLIHFEDVTYPFGYYAAKLKQEPEVFEKFLTEYQYTKAIAFLKRFENWNEGEKQPAS